MYRYSKYIARNLTHSTLLVATSLTSIVWLLQALRLMDFIVNQGVGLDVFLMLTVLIMPSLLMMILPVGLFCAVVFVYQRLKADSELVVMEAAGLSLWRLTRPALTVACGVAIFGYIVSFYIMPVCYIKFRDMQSYLRNNYVSLLLQEGVFNSPVEGLTVFVRTRDSDGNFSGILVHDGREPGTSITMMAEKGRMVATPTGPRFYLTHGNRQEMQNGQLSLLNFDSYTLDMSLYNKPEGARNTDTREMFLPDLLQRSSLSEEEIVRRSTELHQRILWPSYAFTMTLVGLAILLSGEFNRRGNVKRVLTAVISVAALSFVAITLTNLLGNNPVYLIAAYINLVVPALIAAAVLREHLSWQGFAWRKR